MKQVLSEEQKEKRNLCNRERRLRLKDDPAYRLSEIERGRKYRAKYPNAIKEYRAKNRTEISVKLRAKWAEDPIFREKAYARAKRNKARRNERNRIWRINNPEKAKELDARKRKYATRNREKAIASNKRYAAKNKDKLRDYRREYMKTPRAKAALEARRPSMREYDRLRRKTPQGRKAKVIETKRSRYRKKYGFELGLIIMNLKSKVKQIEEVVNE